jgi:pterin-4a-carbinolamine dehydratase
VTTTQGGWKVKDQVMLRDLQFRDFDEALQFFERVGKAADLHGRRPDMCIYEFNHVRLKIENPHHAGFTEAEQKLAAKVDAIIAEHHPGADRAE